MLRLGALAALHLVFVASASAQSVYPGTSAPPPPPPIVEKLGPSTYNVAGMRVDTAKRELSVPGIINDVTVLEFVANTKGGYKAYESAITLETNAISFNVAMLLLGVDPNHGRPSTMQFDRSPPQGDPVDIFVNWTEGGRTRNVRIEELLFDQRTKKTVPKGPWVYTGSTTVDTPDGPRFMAEVDGVLIGLMHGPQAVIDSPRSDVIDGFGAVMLNTSLGLRAGSTVTVVVKALKPGRK